MRVQAQTTEAVCHPEATCGLLAALLPQPVASSWEAAKAPSADAKRVHRPESVEVAERFE